MQLVECSFHLKVFICVDQCAAVNIKLHKLVAAETRPLYKLRPNNRYETTFKVGLSPSKKILLFA